MHTILDSNRQILLQLLGATKQFLYLIGHIGEFETVIMLSELLSFLRFGPVTLTPQSSRTFALFELNSRYPIERKEYNTRTVIQNNSRHQ